MFIILVPSVGFRHLPTSSIGCMFQSTSLMRDNHPNNPTLWLQINFNFHHKMDQLECEGKLQKRFLINRPRTQPRLVISSPRVLKVSFHFINSRIIPTMFVWWFPSPSMREEEKKSSLIHHMESINGFSRLCRHRAFPFLSTRWA